MTSALHLSSLLEVTSRVTELDTPEPLLNVALLSLMGRLKIRRASVLRPTDGGFLETVVAKGLPYVVNEALDITEVAHTETVPKAAPLRDLGVEWLVPVYHKKSLTAVLCLGPTMGDSLYDADVRLYVDLVRNILGIAVNGVETTSSLRKTALELQRATILRQSLFEFARDFSGVLDMQRINRLLGLRLMGQLMTSSYMVVLNSVEHGTNVIGSRGIEERWGNAVPTLLGIKQSVVASTLEHGDPLLDVLDDLRIGMICPLTLHDAHIGVVVVGTKLNAQPYSQEETQFLEAVGSIVISAIENERLEQARIATERLRNELDVASKIQRDLLPEELPSTPGLDIAAWSESSGAVGGDYYDVIALDESRTLVAIADVSGKGVPAALLMANLQAALNILARLGQSLENIITEINRLAVENTEPEVFITIFMAIIDVNTGTIEYVNAGHNPPVLLHEEDVELLDVGGVLTGVIANPPPYRVGVGGIRTGDVLLLYTDGVTESFDEHKYEFGLPALVENIRSVSHMSASGIRDTIKHRLSVFRRNASSVDDTSILCVKIL